LQSHEQPSPQQQFSPGQQEPQLLQLPQHSQPEQSQRWQQELW
jgi:hypothetical protein